MCVLLRLNGQVFHRGERHFNQTEILFYSDELEAVLELGISEETEILLRADTEVHSLNEFEENCSQRVWQASLHPECVI